MLNMFIYRLKLLIRNKDLMFWTLLFPIILVSLFNMAFSNLGEVNNLETIRVGVVNAGNDVPHVIQIMSEVEFNDENLFYLRNVSYEEGRELLLEGEVRGLIKIEEADFSLIVNNAGISQTILSQFLDNYKQQTVLVESQIQRNPELLTSGWLESIGEFRNYIEELQVSEKAGDMTIVMYYTVIALTCLYGAMLAAAGMKNIHAKLSKVGARVNLSPYPKLKMILADFTVSTLMILLTQTILILYLNYVIGISFTTQLGAIALIIVLGSVLSTAFGYLIVLLTTTEDFVTIITMVWCFLAGMMSVEVKVAVENAVPFINFANPAALITDSFQKLVFFEDFSMIVPYLVALFVWTVVFLGATIFMLRRENYDSI